MKQGRGRGRDSKRDNTRAKAAYRTQWGGSVLTSSGLVVCGWCLPCELTLSFAIAFIIQFTIGKMVVFLSPFPL